MLIDTHCHLTYAGLSEREQEVLATARAAGVGAFVTIATTTSEWAAALSVAERHPDVYVALGIHPHHADAHDGADEFELVRAATTNVKVTALGECGLDYHYRRSSPEAQARGFRRHIAAARATGLPIVVHTRDAEADTLAILREAQDCEPISGVIHCFTGSMEFARAVLDLGFYISLSGIVSFNSAKELQAVARMVPDDRLLVETDSPFLAPVPHRGRPCEPAFVVDTARKVADMRGVSLDTLADQTTANARRLFPRLGSR